MELANDRDKPDAVDMLTMLGNHKIKDCGSTDAEFLSQV